MAPNAEINNSKRWAFAAICLGIVVLGHQFWRASHQGITHDEALTYTIWVSQPWAVLDDAYYVNNHVLFTICAKISNDLLWPSELTLRLPALLACGFFFLLSFRFCSREGSFGFGSFLAFVFLISNPFILDFLCCARGYGPGIAALALSIFLMMRLVTLGRRSPWTLFFLGLALASVPLFMLAFSFAAFALGIVFLWIYCMSMRVNGVTLKKSLIDVGSYTVTPALITVAAILGPVLRHARLELFYYGTTGWLDTNNGLSSLWFLHIDREDHPLPGTGFLEQVVEDYGGALLLTFVGLVTIMALVAASKLAKRERAQFLCDPTFVLMAISALGLCLTLLIQSLVHVVADLPLPRMRTALHLVFLSSLSGSSAWLWLARGRGLQRIAFGLLTAILGAIGLLQLSQAGAFEYAEWTWDSGSKRTYEKLEELHHKKSPLRVVSIPFRFAPSQNYYRQIRHDTWLYRVDREVTRELREYDYVLLAQSLMNHPEVALRSPKVLYADPRSDCSIVRFNKP